MNVLDLFAGIGGFTLGLERAGFTTVAFCEIDSYAQKVLKKNWPGVPIYDDVRQITADRLISDGIRVDVITGGFPCQDISVAGKREGIEGERSGLWTECARLIGELQPRYAIFENVTNLLNGERGDWFKRVLWDISSLGYDAEWHCIPASELGAHHHRDRIWIVAYPRRERLHKQRQPTGFGEESANMGRVQCDGLSVKQKNQETVLANPNSNDGRRGDRTQSRKREPRLESGCGGEGQSIAGANEDVADTLYAGLQRRLHWRQNEEWQGESGHPRCGSSAHGQSRKNQWDIEPDVGRVAHGIPDRSHRLKCLGNAVVPPIPELIGHAILENERTETEF
tara:strand:+ start:714 stop:1730 length:1017 start_codon:yes stop_codon:yes gene_type:complete